jgi:hypothetical protein
MGFMIGRVNNRDAVRFQSVSKGQRGMVEILGVHSDTSEIEAALFKVVQPDLSVQCFERDREILIGHLAGKAGLDLPAAVAWGIDIPGVIWTE